MMGRMGPKISSCIRGSDSVTSTITVGAGDRKTGGQAGQNSNEIRMGSITTLHPILLSRNEESFLIHWASVNLAVSEIVQVISFLFHFPVSFCVLYSIASIYFLNYLISFANKNKGLPQSAS